MGVGVKYCCRSKLKVFSSWGNFACFCHLQNFGFFFQNKSFRNIIKEVNSLDPDQA